MSSVKYVKICVIQLFIILKDVLKYIDNYNKFYLIKYHWPSVQIYTEMYKTVFSKEKIINDT